MKILFFLVAIANVAFFMWEYKTGAFVSVTETSEQNADSDQEQIMLVSELTNVPEASPAPILEQSQAGNNATDEIGKPVQVPETLPAISDIEKPALENSAATDSNISNADKIAEYCYEVGPFANQKAYQALANRIKDIKSEIKTINRDDKILSNYMVYYPAAETELESEANIRMLKDQGIKDLWLLTGEDKGNISLGLFNKEESALTMKSELLAKGINSEVKAKYKTKSQKYALIKGDDNLMVRLNDLKNIHPELAVKKITNQTRGCW